jgi:hypothetical protein
MYLPMDTRYANDIINRIAYLTALYLGLDVFDVAKLHSSSPGIDFSDIKLQDSAGYVFILQDVAGKDKDARLFQNGEILKLFKSLSQQKTKNVLIFSNSHFQSTNSMRIAQMFIFVPRPRFIEEQSIGRAHRRESLKAIKQKILELNRIFYVHQNACIWSKNGCTLLDCDALGNSIYAMLGQVEKDLEEILMRASWGCTAMQYLREKKLEMYPKVTCTKSAFKRLAESPLERIDLTDRSVGASASADSAAKKHMTVKPTGEPVDLSSEALPVDLSSEALPDNDRRFKKLEPWRDTVNLDSESADKVRDEDRRLDKRPPLQETVRVS